eukprot:1731151-Lingulodinium_polyedra.AAC.1
MPAAKWMSELMSKDIKCAPACKATEAVKDAVDAMAEGDVVVLDDSRLYEGETLNDPEMEESLADSERELMEFWNPVYRYIAESSDGEAKCGAAEYARRAYEAALMTSQSLAATHPYRLRLALNYSALQYDALGNPFEACLAACKALDDARRELGETPGDSFEDSQRIVQLLLSNLTCWRQACDETCR